MKKLSSFIFLLVFIFVAGCVELEDRDFVPEKDSSIDTGIDTDSNNKSVEDERIKRIYLSWKWDKIKTFINDASEPEIIDDFRLPPRSDFYIVHFSCFGWKVKDRVEDLAARFQDVKTVLRGFNPSSYPERDELNFSFNLPSNSKDFDKCYLDVFTWRSVGYTIEWQAVQFQKEVSSNVSITKESGTLKYRTNQSDEFQEAEIALYPMIEDKRWVVTLE